MLTVNYRLSCRYPRSTDYRPLAAAGDGKAVITSSVVPVIKNGIATAVTVAALTAFDEAEQAAATTGNKYYGTRNFYYHLWQQPAGRKLAAPRSSRRLSPPYRYRLLIHFFP